MLSRTFLRAIHQPSSARRTLKLPLQFAQNQLLPVKPELSGQLTAIVNSFRPPIRYALAYGSAIFPQKSYSDHHRPMLDFIFAVSHPSHWHSINLQHNPHHYSLPARLAGSPAITWLQEHGPGAGLWFNVEANVHDRVIKYGVVSIDTLCNDLLDWNTLYLSGRMHKPTHIIRDDPRVRLAQQVNLASALRTALLLLPERFDELALYRTIAGLSYRGDFRMRWAENPEKVNNIVSQQLPLLRLLYRPLLNALKSHVKPHETFSEPSSRIFIQESSPRARAELLAKLPIQLKERIRTLYDRRWNLKLALSSNSSSSPSERLHSSDELDILTRMATDEGFQDTLREALVDLVARPALYQSVKGIFSAGPIKSAKYAANKVLKRFTPASS